MTTPSTSSPITVFTDHLLQLGKIIHSRGDAIFKPVSKASHFPSSDEMELIELIRKMPEIRKLVTFNDGGADVVEIRVLAVAVFMGLMVEYHPNVRQISEVIGRESPIEIMRARVAIKSLGQRQVLRFRDGQDKTWNGLIIITKATLSVLGLLDNESPIFSEKTLAIQASSKGDGEDAYKNIPKGYIPPAEVIYTRIRETVLGSYLEEPIRSISAMYAMHMHRVSLISRGKPSGTPPVIGLLIGPSSAGKTFLAESCARIVNEICGGNIIPFSSFSATDLTAEGYVGCSIEDCFKPLRDQIDAKIQQCGSCLLLDEIDKKACRVGRGGLDISGKSVQEALLRSLGGSSLVVGGRRNTMEKQGVFSTEKTMFMLAGAFIGLDELMGKRGGSNGMGFGSGDDRKKSSRLRDALIDYGMIPELVSRVGSIIVFPAPLLKDLVEICSAPRGLLSCYGSLWEGMGMQVVIGSSGVRVISDYGIETASYSRGMQSVLNRITEKLVFDGVTGEVKLEKRDITRIIDSMGVGC